MTKFISMNTDKLKEEIVSLTSWVANATPIEPQLPKMEAELNSAKAELNRRKIIDKVCAITHALVECRFWFDMEEEHNYLHRKAVQEGKVGFLTIHRLYISDLIEEMFSWAYRYTKYSGELGDIVVDSFYNEEFSPDKIKRNSPEKIREKFLANPLLAVSEPRYTGRSLGSHFTFDEGQFIDPDGLLAYLNGCSDHGLDVDEVERVFKIGAYLEDREEEEV